MAAATREEHGLQASQVIKREEKGKKKLYGGE